MDYFLILNCDVVMFAFRAVPESEDCHSAGEHGHQPEAGRGSSPFPQL